METVYFCNVQGEKLAGILHTPTKMPAPAVIISHGFGSSKGKKEKWASKLCEAGFAVLRFDFSGHGESDGRIEETTLTKVTGDISSAINFVKGLDARKIGLTGHSLGGTASLLAANLVDAVAPIAPATDFASMYKSLRKAGLVDFAEWRRKGYQYFFGIKINYSFYSDAIKYDAKNISKTIKCPVMLIHGDEDEIVPLQQSVKFFKLLNCKKKFEVIQGAGHNFNAEIYARMIELTKGWFMRQLF